MKDAKSKKKFYLVTILITAVLFFVLLPVFSHLAKNNEIFSTISILVSILLVVLILFFQRKLTLYIFLDQHNTIFSNLSNSFKATIDLKSASLDRKIINRGYELYKDISAVSIYYLVKELENRKKDKTLFLIIIINDERISFENDHLSNLIGEAEQDLFKQHRFRHRIYLQFKEYPHETDELKESTHEIIWTKHGNRSITLINIINFIEDEKLYFVYNKDYLPTVYYKLGCQEIFELTNIHINLS